MTDPADLSSSLRDHLAYMASRGMEGFSGRWEIEMRDGGVCDFRESVRPNLSKQGDIDPQDAVVVASKRSRRTG